MIMVCFPAGLIRLAVCLVLVLLVSSVSLLSAQEEAQAKQRLELMQAALGSLELESSEALPKTALTFSAKPLLRYSDPTRGIKEAASKETATTVLLDASVWRLGTQGRPTALVTIEIYQAPDKSRLLSFEFLSLSETKYSLKHKTQRIRWQPAGSGLKMVDLPDAPRPASTAAARLTQMRQQVRRFAARERLNDESIECRLLTQPIDRYQSEAEKIVDGSIFAFANGTNPEVGILFETDGERWRYGILRLSSAEMSITLDGRQVGGYDKFDARGRTDGPYHNGAYKIETDK
jgi:hypothetical protein